MGIRIASSVSPSILLVTVVDLVLEFYSFALILNQLHERIGSSCFGFSDGFSVSGSFIVGTVQE